MLHYLSLSKKLGGFAAIAALLLLLNGCGSSQPASKAAGAQPALTSASTCSAWGKAGSGQSTSYAKTVRPELPIPSNYQGEEGTGAAVGFIAGRCHREELAGRASQVTLATALGLPAGSTRTANSNPLYPAVKFSLPAEGGSWPFQAQIYSLTESPNGFPGTFVVPERDQTILKVQVSITSLVSGRPVPFPQLNVDCSAVTAKWGEAGEHGWDQGEEDAPIVSGYDLSLGDGKPHLWDAEWAIGEGTTPSEVSCTLEVGPPNGTPSEKQVLNLG